VKDVVVVVVMLVVVVREVIVVGINEVMVTTPVVHDVG